MPLFPRPHVRRVTPTAHGGAVASEGGLRATPAEVLDFSVNSNPLGVAPSIREALSAAPVGRYPDPSGETLRRALATHLGLGPNQIILGNGSLELIRLAAQAYFGPGDRVVLLEPTFGEYKVACQAVAADTVALSVSAAEGFRHKVEAILSCIASTKPRGLFLCNPNNPTGQYFSRSEIEQILRALPDGLVVLDEAYVAFVREPWSSLDLFKFENLLLLRSMTKDFSLAGLRLGFGLAAPAIIEALDRLRPPWNVNAVALEAGLVALGCGDFVERGRRAALEGSDYLRHALTALGLRVWPSDAHFFLVEVQDAPGFQKALLQKGCLVRDCTSFGLPHFIRIAPRTLAECEQLIEAVKELVLDPLATGSSR